MCGVAGHGGIESMLGLQFQEGLTCLCEAGGRDRKVFRDESCTGGRALPTAETKASRAFHSVWTSLASLVKEFVADETGVITSSVSSSVIAACSRPSTSFASDSRNSTSNAVVDRGSSPQSDGTPSTAAHARRVFPSISSTAIAPISLNAGTAAAAEYRSAKKTRAAER